MGVKNPKRIDILKLYVRLPAVIIDEQQVLNLHHNIVEVTLPRQKSRRWCIVHISTDSETSKVIKELKAIQIDGKHLYISMLRTRLGKKPKLSLAAIKSSQ